MRLHSKVRLIVSLFTLATVIYAVKTRQSHGAFLRVPFEFRRPTVQRIRSRWWNPDDESIFTPHVFGVGWSINVYQVGKRLGLLRDGEGAAGELQG